MGSQFSRVTAGPDRELQRYVPRSNDSNGGGAQGHSLVGLTFGEDPLFDVSNGAISDTNAHESYGPGSGQVPANPTGTNFDQVYAVYKTAVVLSTLNKAVSLQPMWSRDGSNWYPFGIAVVVSAYSGSGSPQSETISLSTSSQYVPYVALQAICSVAPTSGTLLAWLERLG